MRKETMAANAEQDDRPKTARLPAAVAGHPMFEHAAAEIGIGLASHHILRCPDKRHIRQIRFPWATLAKVCLRTWGDTSSSFAALHSRCRTRTRPTK